MWTFFSADKLLLIECSQRGCNLCRFPMKEKKGTNWLCWESFTVETSNCNKQKNSALQSWHKGAHLFREAAFWFISRTWGFTGSKADVYKKSDATNKKQFSTETRIFWCSCCFVRKKTLKKQHLCATFCFFFFVISSTTRIFGEQFIYVIFYLFIWMMRKNERKFQWTISFDSERSEAEGRAESRELGWKRKKWIKKKGTTDHPTDQRPILYPPVWFEKNLKKTVFLWFCRIFLIFHNKILWTEKNLKNKKKIYYRKSLINYRKFLIKT